MLCPAELRKRISGPIGPVFWSDFDGAVSLGQRLHDERAVLRHEFDECVDARLTVHFTGPGHFGQTFDDVGDLVVGEGVSDGNRQEPSCRERVCRAVGHARLDQDCHGGGFRVCRRYGCDAVCRYAGAHPADVVGPVAYHDVAAVGLYRPEHVLGDGPVRERGRNRFHRVLGEAHETGILGFGHVYVHPFVFVTARRAVVPMKATSGRPGFCGRGVRTVSDAFRCGVRGAESRT